jgi:hypothetical protein
VVLSTVSVLWRFHEVLVESGISSNSCFKQSFLEGNDGWLTDSVSHCPVVYAQMMDCDTWTLLLGKANEGDLFLSLRIIGAAWLLPISSLKILTSDEGVNNSVSTSFAGQRDKKLESWSLALDGRRLAFLSLRSASDE